MTTKAPQPKNQVQKKGFRSFLRPSELPALMKGSQYLMCEVEDDFATKEASVEGRKGASVGRYGVDIPTTIAGQLYTITLPVWVDDYAALLESWGDDLDTWVGKTLAVWTQERKDSGPGADEVKTLLRFAPPEEVINNGPPQVALPGKPEGYQTPPFIVKKVGNPGN